MYSGRGNAALPALGFPIPEPAGQRMFSSSPRLIAAVHALHRLLVPRHPPCALTILTVIEPDAEQPPGSGDTRLKIGQHLRFSRSGEERRRRGLRRSGLSKLNSVPTHPRERVRVRPGSVDMLGGRRAKRPGGPLRCLKKVSIKVGIQTHLPVQLTYLL